MFGSNRIRAAATCALLLGAALFSGVAGADAPPAEIKLPHVGCVTLDDPTGDDAPPWGDDPDLDLTWITLASPPGQLRAFIHLTALGSPTLIGHLYDVTFTLAGKTVQVLAGEDDSPFSSVPRDPGGIYHATPLNVVKYDGAPVADAVVDAVFDVKRSVVILTIQRAPLEKASKASLADGTVLTDVKAHSMSDAYHASLGADTAAAATGAPPVTYAVGDNHCVLPPKGVLTLTAPTASVFGHDFSVSGVLKDETDKLIAGKPVVLTVAGADVTLTTDDAGAFSRVVPGTLQAGSYGVTASFAGDDDVQAAQASSPVDVKAAPTSIGLTSAVSGKSVIVKTQLLNDVKKPLAGQLISWSVDGKTVKTTKTDATGRTSFTTAPKHTVKASFAGLSGRYLAISAAKRV